MSDATARTAIPRRRHRAGGPCPAAAAARRQALSPRARPAAPRGPGIRADRKLQVHQVDFARLPALPAVDDVYVALGTTIKVAGSRAAFRQVDFDFVVDTARAARAAGATRLAVVSAMGADARSRVFYNRVKGEMEAAIAQLGYESVVIARPSLLLGDRAALGQPARSGETWATRARGAHGLAGTQGGTAHPGARRGVRAARGHACCQARVLVLKSGAMQG
jgi:uncharacterized protein YbjT (DUF2867 family)